MTAIFRACATHLYAASTRGRSRRNSGERRGPHGERAREEEHPEKRRKSGVRRAAGRRGRIASSKRRALSSRARRGLCVAAKHLRIALKARAPSRSHRVRRRERHRCFSRAMNVRARRATRPPGRATPLTGATTCPLRTSTRNDRRVLAPEKLRGTHATSERALPGG